jgi:hypothetical protein
MLINTTTELAQALRQNYEGRAVALLPQYDHVTAVSKLRASLADRVRVFQGPLYAGEAEELLLKPLLRALREANAYPGTARVCQNAYQLAATYSLIYDVTRISMTKDISQAVTVQSLMAQPVVQTLLKRWGTAKPDDTPTPEPDDSRSRINNAWKKIDYVLSNGIAYSTTPDDSSVVTPLMLIYDAMYPSKIGEGVKTDAVDIWNRLLSTLRHGKGMALEPEGRDMYMTVITEILIQIDTLIDNISIVSLKDMQAGEGGATGGKGVAGTESATDILRNLMQTTGPNTAFADAFTAMYWLNLYLDAVAEYDVTFPATELMVQSQAWVLTMKSAAARFKRLFMDISQAAISFDLYAAMYRWEETRKFFQPILSHKSSVLDDVNALWTRNKETADQVLTPFSKAAVTNILDALRGYVQADYLLPYSDMQFASKVLSEFELKFDPNATGICTAVKGEGVITQLDTQGESILSVGDRDILVAMLSESAGRIEEAIGYAKRSRDLLQLSDSATDIYHALIPTAQEWRDPCPLHGTVKDLATVNFSRHDPLQLGYEKYDVSVDRESAEITGVSWKFTPALMEPFYKIQQLQRFSVQRTANSRIIWPGMGDLPVNDVISAAYLQQPLPACYTASRNVSYVANNMISYVSFMTGHSGITAASRDMFRKVAALMGQFTKTYVVPIIDALAATMLVYVKEKNSNEWNLRMPSIPTIYGLPTKAFVDANKPKELNNADDNAFNNAVGGRAVTIRLDDGQAFRFVLHEYVPTPQKMVYIAYPYAKSVYLHVPILSSVWTASSESILKSLGVSIKTFSRNPVQSDALKKALTTIKMLTSSQVGGVKMKKVSGWAPFLLNLPHLLCDYQDTSGLAQGEEFLKYALLSLQMRYEPVERTIYVAGFVDNPVELLTIEDYRAAMSSPDPTPLDNAVQVKDKIEQDDGADPARAQAEAKPEPTTLNPRGSGDQKAALKDVASVTQAPVPVRENNPTSMPTNSNKTVILEVPTEAATPSVKIDVAGKGDPGKNVEQEGEQDSNSMTKPTKYWKKIGSDGTVLAVVAAEECPQGYVPATADEYAKFKKDSDREGDDNNANE